MCFNVSIVTGFLSRVEAAVEQQSLSRAPYDRGSPGVDTVNYGFKRTLVS